jgi:hypothetical protein
MRLKTRKTLGIGLLAAAAIALVVCARRCLRSMARRRAQKARVAVCADGPAQQVGGRPKGGNRQPVSNPIAA